MQHEQVAAPTAGQPMERLRGVVLCHFADGDFTAVESALSRRGVTILRASDDLHALTLAHCARPDVVLTAIDDSSRQAHSFLTELRGTRFGSAISVVALVPKWQQQSTSQFCQQYASTSVVWDQPTEWIVAEVARFLESADRMYRRDDAAIASVDAAFSELGRRKRRRAEDLSPIARSDAAAARIRRIDDQQGFVSARRPTRLPISPYQSLQD